MSRSRLRSFAPGRGIASRRLPCRCAHAPPAAVAGRAVADRDVAHRPPAGGHRRGRPRRCCGNGVRSGGATLWPDARAGDRAKRAHRDGALRGGLRSRHAFGLLVGGKILHPGLRRRGGCRGSCRHRPANGQSALGRRRSAFGDHLASVAEHGRRPGLRGARRDDADRGRCGPHAVRPGAPRHRRLRSVPSAGAPARHLLELQQRRRDPHVRRADHRGGGSAALTRRAAGGNVRLDACRPVRAARHAERPAGVRRDRPLYRLLVCLRDGARLRQVRAALSPGRRLGRPPAPSPRAGSISPARPPRPRTSTSMAPAGGSTRPQARVGPSRHSSTPDRSATPSVPRVAAARSSSSCRARTSSSCTSATR